MDNITDIAVRRGRPESELALSMHATAIGLDNSAWDGSESGLLVSAYRSTMHIACGSTDPDARAEAGKLAMLLAELIEGDRAENLRHSRQVGHLRVLNGRLENAKPAASTAGSPDAA